MIMGRSEQARDGMEATNRGGKVGLVAAPQPELDTCELTASGWLDHTVGIKEGHSL
jgi:hypothetical protein